MRSLIVLVAFPLPLVLAACGGAGPANVLDPQAKAEAKQARERVADARAVKSGFTPDQPKPVVVPNIDPEKVATPGTRLPAATEQYRYIGRWAVGPQMCASGSWRFETRKLTTAGEISCDLPTVNNLPTGYILSGTCRTEGKKTDQSFRLTFDEAARTMRVSGRGLGPIDLIYCGD